MLQNRGSFSARRASPLAAFPDHLKQSGFAEGFDAAEFEEFPGDSRRAVVGVTEQIEKAHA